MFLLTQSSIVLASYLLGCISVGYYLVRWRTGEDLRELGSGATGGRNTGRVLGKGGAIAAGIGDILKGIIAMWMALWFKLEPWALALVMIAVLAGHIWPFQLGFKGGKGLSAAFGAVLMLDYRVALLTAVLALAFLFISRNEFLFLMGIASSPIIAFALGHRWEIVAGMVILVVIILVAHRANIQEFLRSK
jgi:acyl phosphate:glycerol-3-phosphate acyltransferase